MPLTFKDLLNDPPPLKTTTAALPDGREYTLHQLPLGMIARIGELARAAQEKSQDLNWNEFGEIAAQAVLGRPPKPGEVKEFVGTMGRDTVLHIYTSAIRFSTLGEEAVDDAKKD